MPRQRLTDMRQATIADLEALDVSGRRGRSRIRDMLIDRIAKPAPRTVVPDGTLIAVIAVSVNKHHAKVLISKDQDGYVSPLGTTSQVQIAPADSARSLVAATLASDPGNYRHTSLMDVKHDPMEDRFLMFYVVDHAHQASLWDDWPLPEPQVATGEGLTSYVEWMYVNPAIEHAHPNFVTFFMEVKERARLLKLTAAKAQKKQLGLDQGLEKKQ